MEETYIFAVWGATSTEFRTCSGNGKCQRTTSIYSCQAWPAGLFKQTQQALLPRPSLEPVSLVRTSQAWAFAGGSSFTPTVAEACALSGTVPGVLHFHGVLRNFSFISLRAETTWRPGGQPTDRGV